MSNLLLYRELYGHVFVTTFPDGTSIPWKPLSLGEVKKYNSLFAEGRIPAFILEEEIFSKCVVDKTAVQNLGHLKAGVIPTVVYGILAQSDPPDPESFNNLLAHKRASIASNVLDGFVMMVCRAFPAYKPEDVYAMDYITLVERLALAEPILMGMGVIEEPISLVRHGEEQPPPEKERPQIDPRQIKDMYEQKQGPGVARSQQRDSAKMQKILDSRKHTVINTADVEEHEMVANIYHTQDEIFEMQKNMKKELRSMENIYKPYIEQMKRGEKVKIMTDEERIVAAAEREKESKQRLRDKIKEHEKEELKSIQKKHDKVFKFKKKRGV